MRKRGDNETVDQGNSGRNTDSNGSASEEIKSVSNDAESESLNFLETAQSVLFAFLGVQKSKNAKRDFSKGKASHFILLGITFGILFVLSVALVVKLILDQVAP